MTAGKKDSPALRNSVDTSLRERAKAVVPGGMWGHQNAAKLPENYPQFFRRAEGCRLWDVDGNEYLDFMCSWGPMILGYRHPEVEMAARRQLDLGDIMNGPGEVMVELAEALVDTIAHAQWVQFQKNGTDATTFCVTVARAGTKKRKVLVARGSYHGAAPWCTPSLAGVTAEDRAHLVHFDYNDIDSLDAAAQNAGDDLAAIIVSPVRQELRRTQEFATPEFARRIRAICDGTGAALILDEVRCGFRLDLAGSWEVFGVRPDLSAYSKAIANGMALAAVAGVDRFRDAATQVYSTGSFWCAAGAMAAALETLRVLKRDDGIARMAAAGQQLRDGIQAIADRHGIGLRQSGPVQMPLMLFEDDEDFSMGEAFCSAAIRNGLYFHPWHNMFLSSAHGEKDIGEALERAERAFAELDAARLALRAG